MGLLESTATQVRVSVSASIIICLLIAGLHFYQRSVYTQQAAESRSFREARLDLLMGFLHVENASQPESPFDPGQGIALMRQAIVAFERSATALADSPEDVREKILVFQAEAAQFESEVVQSASTLHESPQRLVEFRVRFHRLTSLAEDVDKQFQSKIAALAESHSRVFWCVFVTSVILMTIVLTFVLLANRRAAIAEASRSLAEAEIRRSANLLEAIINSTPDVIFVKDLAGRYLVSNLAMERFLNRPRSEIRGKSDCDLFGDEQGGNLRSQDEQVVENLTSAMYETRIPSANGSRTFSVTKAPLVAATGEVLGVVGVSRDITERQRMIDDLAISESRLKLFVEHSPAAVVMLDREFRYLVVSRRWRTDFVLMDRKLEGVSHFEVFPEIPERWRAILYRVLGGETLAGDDDLFERRDGVVQWVKWEARPWTTSDGEIGGIVIFSEDVTERHLAQKALIESEERFRLLFEDISEGLYLFDDAGVLVNVNRSACDALGYSREQLIGRNVDFFDRTIRPDQLSEIQEQVRRGCVLTFDTVHIRSDGSTYDAEIRSRPIRIGAQQFSLASARNVSERKEAERLLREERDRLAVLAETSPGILLSIRRSIDGQWSFPYVNAACETIFGIRPDELKRDAMTTASLFTHAELVQLRDRMATSLELLQPMLEEHPIQHPVRGRIWVRSHLSPVRQADGATIWHGFIVDITSLKEAEERIRAMNTELEQRVRLRTIDLESANRDLESFSYSVSHDLRAPLRAVNGFSQILIREYGDMLPPQGQEYLADIAQGAKLMGQLVDDLLAFSRLGRKAVNRSVVNMNSLVRQVVEELEKLHPDRQIAWNIQELPDCVADPSLLRQVWQNLLGNAVKYSSTCPLSKIEIGVGLHSEVPEYYVRDNGVGFDMKYAGKLFGVFQRLHRAEEFEGTGIGLALVQKILHRHGGSIRAEATPELGATFYFTVGGVERD